MVIDEADRLIKGHFDDQVIIIINFFYDFTLLNKSILIHFQLQTIFTALPVKKQTLLFSATITETLQKLKEVVLNDAGINAFSSGATPDLHESDWTEFRYFNN